MSSSLPRGVAVGLLAVALTACSGPGDPVASPSPGTPTSSPTAVPPTPTAAAPTTPPAPPPPPVPVPPVTAPDPAALAAQLVAAERALRSDATDDVAAAEAGVLQQAGYRQLALTPAWREAVLAAVPADLRPVVVAHADAAEGLSSLARPQRSLPSWRIVPPPPAAELLGHYRAAEAEFGIGWEHLAAIHLVETRMGRIRGTSSAGARGPMQFMPGTWAQYGEGDIEDPRDAIRAAARYLRASGGPGDMDAALFAYNRSRAYVRAVRAYAEQLRADPRLYRGYHAWQVYYRTVDGDRLLPEGWDGSTGPS